MNEIYTVSMSAHRNGEAPRGEHELPSTKPRLGMDIVCTLKAMNETSISAITSALTQIPGVTFADVEPSNTTILKARVVADLEIGENVPRDIDILRDEIAEALQRVLGDNFDFVTFPNPY